VEQEENMEHVEQARWSYRKSAPRKSGSFDFLQFFNSIVTVTLMYGYFTVMPFVVFLVMDWAAYLGLNDTFYDEPWMRPGILLLSVFLSGAFSRIMMKIHKNTMLLFVVGIMGLVSFAVLTWHDINSNEFMFSLFLPQHMPLSLLPLVYSLPAVGLVGMLFYGMFEMKRAE
jgi:hypothetical protein